MPCFTLVLEEANTVYRLRELIDDQVTLQTGEQSLYTHWQEVNIQSDYDNSETEPLKIGDRYLSGLRYGRVLKPGEVKCWNLMPHFTDLGEIYLLCEGAGNQRVAVELI